LETKQDLKSYTVTFSCDKDVDAYWLEKVIRAAYVEKNRPCAFGKFCAWDKSIVDIVKEARREALKEMDEAIILAWSLEDGGYHKDAEYQSVHEPLNKLRQEYQQPN